jgi:hypothetical protein
MLTVVAVGFGTMPYQMFAGPDSALRLKRDGVSAEVPATVGCR